MLDRWLAVSRRLVLPAWLAAPCVVFLLAALPPRVTPKGELTKLANPLGLRDSLIAGIKTFESSQDGLSIKIRTQGKFELTDDWTGIARLAPWAEMRFEQKDDRTKRRLDVEPGKGGRPVYTWEVDGKPRVFDAAGTKWLQGMLLHFVRGTGYDVERRVAWFLQHRGPDGLLAEISQIPGDYGKRRYFEQLFASRGLETRLAARLDGNVVQRAIAQAGKEIQSDYELTQALLAAAGSPSMNGSAALAYMETARSIESDYDQRRALTGFVKKGPIVPSSAVALLRSAQGIGSDYDLAELLLAFLERSALDDTAVLHAYGEAVRGIGSDYEHRRTLSAAVRRGDLSQEGLLTVLGSAREISSGHERATLLIEIAGRYSLSGTTRESYLDAAGSIGSSHDRLRAEAALGRGRSIGR